MPPKVTKDLESGTLRAGSDSNNMGIEIDENFNFDDLTLPSRSEYTEESNTSYESRKIKRIPNSLIRLIASAIIFYKNRENDNSFLKYNLYFKRTVFRYRAFDENTVDALENHYIYHSNVEYFNDPYDCMAKQAFSVYTHDSPEISDEEFKSFETLLRHTAVACFSKTHKSLLMWSHYAKNHFGICIEYYTSQLNNDKQYSDDEILVDFHKNYILKNNQFFKNLFEIKYARQMIFEKDELTSEKLVSLADIFLRKYSNWRYEKEVRRVIYVPNPTIKKFRKFYHDPEAIKSIYIGAKAHRDTIQAVLEIVKHCYQNKVKVYQAELLPDSYKLEFRLITNL